MAPPLALLQASSSPSLEMIAHSVEAVVLALVAYVGLMIRSEQGKTKADLIEQQGNTKAELVAQQSNIKADLIAQQTKIKDDLKDFNQSLKVSLETHIARDDERFDGIGRTLTRMEVKMDKALEGDQRK